MSTQWRRQTLVAVLLIVITIVAGGVAAAQDRDFTPVTDAMLQDPDPADWLNWRRTLDGWGYSPLDQITTDNVHQLQLVWSWQLGPGNSQPTPLVHDGVMYIPNPGKIVQATRRTSLIVDPPDGRMPFQTWDGRMWADARRESRRDHPADS